MKLSCAVLLGALSLVPAYAEEPVAAPVTATDDVEATMKQMSFTFKQAEQAQTVAAMQASVTSLQQLVASVQAHQFPTEKQVMFQRGLTEVQAQLSQVEQSLAQGDLAKAKEQLAPVLDLKKQYHKERSPSIWRMIFGD